jgi:hypothetical protein
MSRQAVHLGAALRAQSPNRERYIAQSAGVRFGLLPERLIDLDTLARELRATYPEPRHELQTRAAT